MHTFILYLAAEKYNRQTKAMVSFTRVEPDYQISAIAMKQDLFLHITTSMLYPCTAEPLTNVLGAICLTSTHPNHCP